MIDFPDTLLTVLGAFPVESMTPKKVIEATTKVLETFCASINEIDGVVNPDFGLEYQFDENDILVKVYIKFDIEAWTMDLHFAMFDLLEQGFIYIAEKKQYGFGFVYP